jgi:hypothetical protein
MMWCRFRVEHGFKMAEVLQGMGGLAKEEDNWEEEGRDEGEGGANEEAAQEEGEEEVEEDEEEEEEFTLSALRSHVIRGLRCGIIT